MSRYGQLAAKVDAFFTRVQTRHGADMQCASGCHDCCSAGLTITGVDAEAIRAEVASWEPARRQALAHVQAAGCAALDDAGRCRVYAARPIVCRSHGAPIRLRDVRSIEPHSHPGVLRAPLAKRSLPVVDACGKNFTATTPDADCVLDQTTLSALVLAVDQDAGGDGSRTAIADLLAALAR